MMIKLVLLSICLIAIFIQQSIADPCSYDHCYKEELTGCKTVDSREHCNSIGSLFITYREGSLSFSKHKCCNMTLADLPKKYLYCVRNIRTKDLKCSSDNSDSYKIKIRTLGGCSKFTCE